MKEGYTIKLLQSIFLGSTIFSMYGLVVTALFYLDSMYYWLPSPYEVLSLMILMVSLYNLYQLKKQ